MHALRLTHDACGQLLNARRECGAEHHGLLAVDGELVDLSQIIGKAQVEHTVGFVHHQELDLVQLDLHGALQVEQTAGCGHHQISVLQLGDLQLVRHTAHHVGHAQTTAMLDQVDGVVRHLLCQFAGWANDQSARCWSFEVACVGGVFALGALGCLFAIGCSISYELVPSCFVSSFGLSLLLNQCVQHGQQEGGCFAATSLARHHQVDVAGFGIGVVVWQSQRNGFLLNCGGLCVAEVSYGLHQFTGQAQFDEAVRHVSLFNFSGVNAFSRYRVLSGNRNSFGRRKFACHI